MRTALFVPSIVALLLVAQTGAAELRVLDRGRFLHDASAVPPRDGAAWTPVTLPDDWQQTHPDLSGIGWYRFDFEVDAVLRERQAVYLPKVIMNAAVFLNGERIGQGGSLEPPVAQSWNRPLYFPFSPSLLRVGTNRIDVRMYRLPDCFGKLLPVSLGPDSQLRPVFEARYLRQVSLSEATTALGLFAAMVILAFALASRDPVYAYFTVATLFWTIGNLNYHVRDIPISSQAWERLICVSLVVSFVPFALFLHRLRGIVRPAVDRVLLGAGAAAVLALVAVPPPFFHATFNVCVVGSMGIALYAFSVVLTRSEGEGRLGQAGYLVAGVSVFGLAAQGVLIQLGVLSTDGLYWSTFAGPVLTVWFGAFLTFRFIRTFQRAENQNVELERRIDEKRGELERNFARVKDLEREQLVGLERERIMREMHDGLGGQLVRTLALAEGGRATPEDLTTAIRAALDDMRLVIDSLDPLVDDLSTLLGTLRGRLEPSLRRQGLRFEWRAADLPATPDLGPEEFLHILRILQEAITNVLKHAKAHTIRITTGERGSESGVPGLFIVVRDDGIGLDSAAAPGRGRANMGYRAEKLGGQLSVRRVPERGGGTLVDLWIPLARSPESPPSGGQPTD